MTHVWIALPDTSRDALIAYVQRVALKSHITFLQAVLGSSMGFTVTHHHSVTYTVDGELRPDEVDLLNRTLATQQTLADALNAVQNKENVLESKGTSHCGGLAILQKTRLVTPAKVPLGCTTPVHIASNSPTSIATSPSQPTKHMVSLPPNEISPSLLVRSSSLAPTDAPSLFPDHYDTRSQCSGQATDTLSTTCVADSEACSRRNLPEAADICLGIELSSGAPLPMWANENTSLAELRRMVQTMTRIPTREQVIIAAGTGTSGSRELFLDFVGLKAVSRSLYGMICCEDYLD